MVDPIQITSVPVIAAIVFGVFYVYKLLVKNEKWIRLIPIFAAILGAVLGVIAFYAVPEIIPSANVIVALIVGAASGLAATGAHQVVNQLTKGAVEIKGDAGSAASNIINGAPSPVNEQLNDAAKDIQDIIKK